MSPPGKSDRVSVNEDRDVTLAAILFTAVGVGYLFPFSALMQPVDYWHKIFPDFNIEFPLTTLYMWVNLVFLFLIVFFGGEPSYTFRIVGGFAGQLIVLICVPSFYFLDLDESTHFTLIMCATAVAAIATAFVDSVAIGFAAQFPTKVQEALQFGIGFSTLIGSIYRVVTKIVFPVDQVVESSLLYFYSGAATIVLCIYAYYWLLSLPIAARCLSFGVSKDTTSGNNDDTERLVSSRAGRDTEMQMSNRGASATGNDKQKLKSYGSVQSDMTEQDAAESDGVALDRWVLLKKVAFSEFIVFLVFFSTLLLWPPLITEIKSFNFPHLQETQWWPLLLLTVFSVSDCLGRLSIPYRGWLTAGNIWIAAVLRLGLFPLLICSAQGIVFTNDFFSVLFVFALGFTNGYLGSLGIIFINEQVTTREKGLVGTFTGFFLNLGLVFGASAAYFVEKLVLSK